VSAKASPPGIYISSFVGTNEDIADSITASSVDDEETETISDVVAKRAISFCSQDTKNTYAAATRGEVLYLPLNAKFEL